MLKNETSLLSLSFHDIMMRKEVILRLRKITTSVDEDYSFIREHFGEQLKFRSEIVPNYIQNFILSFNKSYAILDKPKHKNSNQFRQSLSTLSMLTTNNLICLPSTTSLSFYEPLNTLNCGIKPSTIPVFSCKENLIDLACLRIIEKILCLYSYQSLILDLETYNSKETITIIKGQLDIHRIVAEVSVDQKEIKLRKQLSLLYT